MMKAVALLLSTIILVNSSSANVGEIPQVLIDLLPDDFGPVKHPLLNASESDVTLYFHSRYTDDNGIIVDRANPASITSIGFDTAKQTVFVVHGWQNDHTSAVNQQIRKAYLQAQDVNVVLVEWTKIAKLGYIYAQSHVQFVGEIVGNYINQLVSQVGVPSGNIRLVGHSLGAHIAGIAGSTTGGSVGWIVGLDPAGPLFSVGNTANRLDPSDAHFVEAIHTCTGLLGFGHSIGHADYWPNGGSDQPGCGLDAVGTCRHSRSYYYYAESLTSGNFISIRCNNYDEFAAGTCQDGAQSRMGEANIDMGASQNYYLTTNAAAPFARG